MTDPTNFDRACWDLAGTSPHRALATLLLRSVALRLFLSRSKRVKLQGRDYIKKSVEYWSDELGPSYDQVRRALRDLRKANAILCRYPHGGFLHVALTPSAEAVLRPAFEKGRKPTPSGEVALGSSCDLAQGDNATSHAATVQLCTDTIDSKKETLGKEDSSSSSAPSVQGKGSKAKGEEVETRAKIRKAIMKMYAEAGAQFHFTEQREGFLGRLAHWYGEDAPALLKAVADDWDTFRHYVRYGKGNHTPAKKEPPECFDLKWCCYSPEILRDWAAWHAHKAQNDLKAQKFSPEE